MALTQNQDSNTHPIPQQEDRDTGWNHLAKETKDEGGKISLIQKLMLNASLFGNESAINFLHLYTVPVLQTLGLPLRLATITGVFSGPTATFVLPLVGWWADQGSRPQRRKTMAAIFMWALALAGMLCVLMGNVLHLSTFLQKDGNNGTLLLHNEANTTFLGKGPNTTFLGKGPNTTFLGKDANTTFLGKGPNTTFLDQQHANTTPLRKDGNNASLHKDVNQSAQVHGDPSNLLSKDGVTLGYGSSESSGKLNGSGLGLADGVVNDSLIGSVVTDVQEDFSGIPVKAGLALLGYVLLDVGVDGSSACIRSCVLSACGSRAEHTSILLIGLVMASGGGLSMAAQGLVDFPSLLGLSDIEGAGLTIQTTVQALVSICLLFLCLPITLHTVRRLLKRSSSSSEEITSNSKVSNSQPHFTEEDNNSTPRKDHFSRSVILNSFENSVRSFGSCSVHVDHSMALLGGLQRSHSSDHHLRFQNSATERMPLLGPGKNRKESEGRLERSQLASMSVSYINGELHGNASQNVDMVKTSEGGGLSEKLLASKSPEDQSEVQTTDTESRSCHCERGFRVKVFLVTLSTFFSSSDIYMFSMSGSDFVGKAIYGGHPAAPLGSKSLDDYEHGVRMASIGFFIYFLSFLVNSLGQSQMVRRLGYRVEFTLVHVLMAVMMAVVSLTERLEMFYLLSMVAGAHRACIFTVPFAVINDLVQKRASQTEGKSYVGFAFSLVMASMPMSYFMMFTWIGPLEEATGVVAVPFWVACVTSFLSIASFLAIGKV